MSGGRALVAGAVAAAAAGVGGRLLVRTVRSDRWRRTNHAGDPVTLLEGPALVAGAVLGSVVAGPAGVVAAAGAGALGALDDLAGDGSSKGLRGHLGALARGEVTTGAVKVLGIGVTGLLAAAVADRRRADRTTADLLAAAGVVAGSANLANLLDLRPGRALKVTVAAALPLALTGPGPGRAPAAAAVGASLGVLPDDLAGRSMLGDTGANAAGALVGLALVERTGRSGRLAALAVLVALTLASERVSFTAVIESTPGLREVDAWGRSAR
ncbi:hypothetical protein KC207_02150 [Phycicoccus sp. BSK3Z-2]|uniref:UDP-N-acetylmuramyl pentapeptide phosphotransferase/UDP-N-acetylglucosamine-1-phosphate transferase n=1 Tax=Phycicoccus avicenniae TaxID=2828860 RepID=A0A941D5R6_9MICO|nr:hypothetical protein [Phycicoccus avicenniae]MBR7742093.1 hypothetical protein [Phycicoccus avicenniae]